MFLFRNWNLRDYYHIELTHGNGMGFISNVNIWESQTTIPTTKKHWISVNTPTRQEGKGQNSREKHESTWSNNRVLFFCLCAITVCNKMAALRLLLSHCRAFRLICIPPAFNITVLIESVWEHDDRGRRRRVSRRTQQCRLRREDASPPTVHLPKILQKHLFDDDWVEQFL